MDTTQGYQWFYTSVILVINEVVAVSATPTRNIQKMTLFDFDFAYFSQNRPKSANFDTKDLPGMNAGVIYDLLLPHRGGEIMKRFIWRI